MKIKTSRTAPDEIAGKEYAYPSFASGIPFPEKITGKMPAMGWNSWNAFGSGNTEALTKAMAEKIIELGLDKLGYKYLVLDDGCYKPERVDGRLANEPVKFPSGFRALADYLHEKGLKFGMYNDVGTRLCGGSEVGTCGFEDLDGKSYTEWDIDFLKVDNCYYLWDNATFSDAENARFTYAPEIKGIRITGAGNGKKSGTESGAESGKELCAESGTESGKEPCAESGKESGTESFALSVSAAEGIITGQGAYLENDYVTNIGTFDGTNTGTTPVGERSGELKFIVDVPEAGEYQLYVTYRSGKRSGCGEWLQAAVGEAESEIRFFDALLPESPVNTERLLAESEANTERLFVESEAITVKLEKGSNVIRLMNHRRQENTLNAYAAMFYAMKAADPDKDIILSLCEWGKTQPHNWAFKMGNSWRILNDITFSVGRDGDPGSGSWDHPGTQSIVSQYNKAVVMDEFASPVRGWNDPDMMVIGMNDISETMSKSHMAMWCMMNSPLMLGLDLRRVEQGDEIHRIISNKELIELNQDALGVQAKRVYSSILENEAPDLTYITNPDRVDILVKPLANGDAAISFFNLSREKKSDGYSVSADTILSFMGKKMTNADAWKNAQCFEIKDLWTGETKEQNGRLFSVDALEGCDSVTWRVRVK